MGFKELLARAAEKKREKKEMARQLDNQLLVKRLIEDRQKSANERELERFLKEEKEKQMKEALELYRKEKDLDVKFGHNPLNTENIISKTDFNILHSGNSVMRSKNLFFNRGFI